MWYTMWNNLLYVYTSGYNKYPIRRVSYDWQEASVWVYIVLAGIVVMFSAGVIYACWDMVSDTYWRFVNRHKVKAVTISVQGKEMTQHKLDKMTVDINGIMAGNRIVGIQRTHKLSATDIVGMSAIPQDDSFLFTVWYK